MNRINFLGLGFELGQQIAGLAESSQYARSYLKKMDHLGLHIVDRGTLAPNKYPPKKAFSQMQFQELDWGPYKEAYCAIKDLLSERETLINWGGDHSVAISTVGAFCAKFPSGYVLWIDAHADLNLPEHSPTGNLHGMPMSVLLNLSNIRDKSFAWIDKNLCSNKLIYLGLRDLDPFEVETIINLGIKVYTSADVQRRGMGAIADEILEVIGNNPLHISFDIDSLSPDCAPSTGVPVLDGLQLMDLVILGQRLKTHRLTRSIDIVEINPQIGSDAQVFQTFMAAKTFLIATLKHGGNYVSTCRTHQAFNSAQMEPSS